MTRREELAANVAATCRRIAAACVAAGRAPEEVTLIVVTKTFPASDVRLLAELGVRDIGENRDQEARAKAEACAGLDIRWHFVGQLQTNKARSVASYAHTVHSVDRARLVAALDQAAQRAGRRLACLVQVDLEHQSGSDNAHSAHQADAAHQARGGALPEDVPGLAEAIAGSAALDLGGVMAVAPLAAAPEPAFERLAAVAAALRRNHPEATIVSAGMSGDLEPAIAVGATHVRVGTAVLGARPPLG
jgi:pyridoxal phosphate enzyme (YggS family)